MHQDVPDYLRPGLKLVLIGINPGLRSGATGHHYAFPGNHFWPLLYQSGLLPEPLTYADDHRVLEFDIGLTNLCDRTSREASELTRAELAEGAVNLREKLFDCAPGVACFNGMGIYEVFSGRKGIKPGLQPEKLAETLLFVVPSSSGRTAAYPRPVKLDYFRQLKQLVDRLPAEASV
ncbi:MAG TPA: mismatch-specific DNA-glycosylase [Dehalococcoidia bacterium]|nr:mismatch-specific DNA-glycosylase [Dehalococcoidia bacterium]